MKVSSVKFRSIEPKLGLIGFASVVIDDWLYLNNIAVFSRRSDPAKIRLVFPEKRIGSVRIPLYHPLDSERYYMLEDAILIKVQTQHIWN